MLLFSCDGCSQSTVTHWKLASGYKFKCEDIGMKDCPFEIKGASSRDEAKQVVATHARMTHNLDVMPVDLSTRVDSAIKG